MLIVASLSRIGIPAASMMVPAVWPLAGSGPMPLHPAPPVTSAVPADNYPAQFTHPDICPGMVGPGV